MTLQKRHWFQLTAIFSLMFALLGFSYNVWRMEVTEHNANIRDASFEMLKQLSELELIVYAAYYDQDRILGNPRQGWVKVGLINDLAMIASPPVRSASQALREQWQQAWQGINKEEASVTAIVAAIEENRQQVRVQIRELQ
ncbi:hypothetical protein FJQ87_14585 [Shewanella sp. SNU WT4]|uniref:hypothetical protein n=1 Tax=Shewanella sp. SNU WT4 TaxID=2590015 RepID=UPI00112D39AD|nr:hypothetical protein [Shewanella sp. SNU WT4]QDF67735.1 hypothetical protein FJQ87_14585 [Shewanella sp. SNU WT4]